MQSLLLRMLLDQDILERQMISVSSTNKVANTIVESIKQSQRLKLKQIELMSTLAIFANKNLRDAVTRDIGDATIAMIMMVWIFA